MRRLLLIAAAFVMAGSVALSDTANVLLDADRLKALTEVMAQEWAEWHIRVNALAPGSYHSDLTDGAIESIPGYGEGMVQAALIPRIADTEEILGPVFYLASEAFTTGITLVADGGLMAKR